MKTDKENTRARKNAQSKPQWANLTKPDAARFSDPEYLAKLMPPPLPSEVGETKQAG